MERRIRFCCTKKLHRFAIPPFPRKTRFVNFAREFRFGFLLGFFQYIRAFFSVILEVAFLIF